MKNTRYFIVFLVIGVFCVFVDYNIYLLLLSLSLPLFVAKILSSTVSVSVNYLLNSKFNFNNSQKISPKFYLQYLLLYAVLILLNALINIGLIKITSNIKLSFWLAAIIAAFTNYIAVKLFFSNINQTNSRR